jgi:ADP-ribosyl-[dinitrogen reductase] hydrolase
MRAPDARFEAGWQRSRDTLLERLQGGGRVLVHCRGGLGRSGTVAARLLLELDWPARQAIAQVRQARPGAIETAEQLQHLLNLPQRKRQPA